MLTAVDLFAGAGGSTTGAVTAGISVVAAVNHWPVAVASHTANHPGTRHFCEDAAVLDPTTLPEHDILVASPSCTGHTRARGAERPHHDAARATAWCVVRVAEARQPRAIVVENVPEFLRWRLFPAWRSALELLGYAVAWSVLDAADFGVPQNRARVFITAICGRRAMIPTAPVLVRHRPASCAIDFGAGTWSPVAAKCDRTRERVASGRREFGEAFLVAYYGSERGGRSLARPIGTLTTHDRYAVVRGNEMRMLSVAEMLALSGFAPEYTLTGTRAERTAQIGNCVPPPLAAGVIAQVAGRIG